MPARDYRGRTCGRRGNIRGQLDLRAVVGCQRNRRIDAVTLEMVEVAEGVGAFIEDVQPRGDVLVDRLPRIQRDTAIAPGAGLRCRFIDARAVGLLERAVDEAATGSATEGNRGRPFQDLDALRVVDVTEILHVIAETIDVEVGTGINAADHQFVAIALALVHGDARNVARHVGEIL